MSDTLFNEFDPVSAKQWKQKIQADLKGADYNDTLIWTSNEGIQVKPFYHTDDFNEAFKTTKTSASNFKIGEIIFASDAKKANALALSAVNDGVESLKFIIPSEDIDFDVLLDNINLDAIPVHFEFHFLSVDTIKKSISKNSKSNIYITTDIIGNLAKSGNWFSSFSEDFLKFEGGVNYSNAFTVDIALYQNAGANIVQQLAYAMAHINEYFNHLENTSKEKTPTIDVIFNVAVGSNYFFEIAKLRALRLLFNTLETEYTINYNCKIAAIPTKRNKAIYDYNTNMLRTTTECMSAILGGADTVCNLPYDAIFHKENDFGRRIAKNQLLVLKHESYFGAVDNPSDGAYYIEALTQQMADKALALFKDIEATGGFLKQLKDGTIQRKIKESATKEQEQFNAASEVILGSNKHPNTTDKMKDNLEIYPFLKTKKRKTLIEPIIEKRVTETLEQKRLKTE
ncbi:heterodimeric methylmalonyl-CoA mutase small subunit [Hyunsoonleella jejuensis]|uniref:Heterodimeric methylmalonyl-CoA mutase small subunit n=1 Tax=Hyunsoonleella jejuensis TaxID=419940 RepID=A0A1H9IJC2_9FLAO|nr:methylmalonyl-CoA mutase subunit beta [Hyunsoonleella jejuensis]SEQ74639.1 heterodimeric methylmalonyl-CoA mutase small subunit [Hyunsoonleella jejuensis]